MKPSVFVFCATSLIFLAWAMDNVLSANQQQGFLSQTTDIRDFVRQTFIHGVPYEEASKHDSDAVPILLEMLTDTTEQPYWSNIVVTLGIVGNEKAVDPLIAFINEDYQGTLSHSLYTAKTSAIISLGYLINKSGNKKALSYLIDCLSPGMWMERNLKWVSPYHRSIEDRNIELSKMAILGLALSGRPDAGEALRSIKRPAETELAKRFQAEAADLIDEALEEYEIISQKGLFEYQKEVRKRHQH